MGEVRGYPQISMSEERPSATEETRRGKPSNLVVELCRFFLQNKKYWMIPIVLILLGFGFLIILGGTAVAPFIYTLF